MPYDIFSRLMYFQTGFFGTNPISYLDSVNVSDQEYIIYFTHVQMSSFKCNLTEALNFGQYFDQIMVKFYPLWIFKTAKFYRILCSKEFYSCIFIYLVYVDQTRLIWMPYR